MLFRLRSHCEYSHHANLCRQKTFLCTICRSFGDILATRKEKARLPLSILYDVPPSGRPPRQPIIPVLGLRESILRAPPTYMSSGGRGNYKLGKAFIFSRNLACGEECCTRARTCPLSRYGSWLLV